MTTQLETLPVAERLPAVPWRDPHTVERRELAAYIAMLETK